MRGTGSLPAGRTGKLAAVEIHLPTSGIAGRPDVQVAEAAAEDIERAHSEIDAVERESLAHPGSVGLLPEREPAVYVQRVDIAPHPQSGTLGLSLRAAQGKQRTLDDDPLSVQPTLQGQSSDAAIADRDAVVSALVRSTLDLQRHRVGGGLAERRRKVDYGALEARLEHPGRQLGPADDRHLPR